MQSAVFMYLNFLYVHLLPKYMEKIENRGKPLHQEADSITKCVPQKWPRRYSLVDVPWFFPKLLNAG